MNDTTNNDEPTKWVQVPRVWLERLMPTIQKHSDAAMIHTAEWSLNNEPTKPTRKRIAEALFYASRRDDWDVATEDEREEFYDMADSPHVLALFSQTTGEQPSVLIPDWVLNEPATDLDGNVISQPTPRTPNAALVRVEDMAPGTTFTGCIRGDIRRTWFLRERGSIVATDGSFAHLTAIDPSTIRDVTPPPALPEDGR